MFADDTSLFVTIDKDEQTCIAQLNRDLERINSWSKKWLVSFNPDKSETLFITLKQNQAISPVYLDNQEINVVSSHKHLGVIFNEKLTWNTHIDNIYSSGNKKVTLLSKLKYTLDRKTLLTMYCSFVRPSLEYANVLWNNCTDADSDRIESIQRRAARIITGGISRTSTELLNEELGLELLTQRRERNLLLFFHKIMYGNCPLYLQNLKPLNNQSRHNRNLRSSTNLDIPKSRIARYENSVIPKAISLWNNLPNDLQSIANYKSFKSQLENDIRKPNEIYYVGERNLNIILARIRMNCSNLNGHLFNLKLTDDPRCPCGYFFEDSVHFFFVCPLYLPERHILHNFVSTLVRDFTLKTLLQGSPNLSKEDNILIVKSVIQFIKSSKRFDK